jgi:TPR repeat protein
MIVDCGFEVSMAAARKGDVEAMRKVGDLYYDYEEINDPLFPKDYEKAFYWHKKAALKGNSVSMFRLWSMYKAGKGVKGNGKLAFSWCQKSAEAGYYKGMSRLSEIYKGAYYIHSFGSGYIKKDIEKSRFWGSKALIAYKKAIKNGDVEAMYLLGCAYDDGEGVKENHTKAIFWLEKAAEKGNVRSMNRLYYLYNLQKDPQKALFWLKKSAESGSISAMRNLAKAYHDGKHGLKENALDALFWFKQAANDGADKDSALSIGCMYFYGQGIEPDIKEATNWLETAAIRGSSDAMILLGKIHRDNKDFQKAVEMFEKAGKQKDENAFASLARVYLYGEGVEKDYLKAVDYCIKGRVGGYMGYCLLDEMIEKKDVLCWFQKEAENGNNDAAFALGYIYENANNVHGIPSNNCDYFKRRAFYWFKKLADDGYAAAMYRLAELYEYDLFGDATGCKCDDRKKISMFWYKKAAKLGDKDAIKHLKSEKTLGRIGRNIAKKGEISETF